MDVGGKPCHTVTKICCICPIPQKGVWIMNMSPVKNRSRSIEQKLHREMRPETIQNWRVWLPAAIAQPVEWWRANGWIPERTGHCGLVLRGPLFSQFVLLRLGLNRTFNPQCRLGLFIASPTGHWRIHGGRQHNFQVWRRGQINR